MSELLNGKAKFEAIKEKRIKEAIEAKNKFMESLDKIIISKEMICNTVYKQIDNKFYSFSYSLYQNEIECYNINIGDSISDYGYIDIHYTKQYTDRKYPKKYEKIFEELRKAK